MIGQLTHTRLLGHDVALLHATGSTIMPGGNEAQARRPSIQTLVASRRDGRWIFTAFHNNRIQHWNAFQYMFFGIMTKLFRR